LQNWRSKRSPSHTVRSPFKVSEKGAVSVYGLGRFPVTLYGEQWKRLFSASDDIQQFIEQNRDRLKKKSD